MRLFCKRQKSFILKPNTTVYYGITNKPVDNVRIGQYTILASHKGERTLS